VETVAQIDKTNRKSTAKSWLAVMVLAAGIFGPLYTVAKFTSETMARWFYRWDDYWTGTSLALLSVLILALTILLAAVLAHGFRRQRIERKALILGSWVLYLPAFVGDLFAVGGLSYLMLYPAAGGGLMSAAASLLIRNDAMVESDWRNWIAIGRVGHGAVDRPDNGAWQIAPLLIVAIGLAITIVGFVQVFRAHREKRLQKDGLYATVRHPQHLGIALWTFGLALAASTTAAYMTWFTMLYLYILLAFWEEKGLSQHFGGSYDGYRHSTPFMIPLVNIGLPLPESRWWRVPAFAGYYFAGLAILCLIMMAIGVDANLYL
jgi:hypothetical protein